MMTSEVFGALPLALKRRYIEYHLKKSGMTRSQIRAAIKALKNSKVNNDTSN